MTATPAFAGSPGTQTVAVTTTNMRVTASGQTQVKAQVNSGSTPVSGATVSFTGPSGSSFSPSSATTDSTGTATTNLTLGNSWAKPGSTVTVTAVSGSVNASQGLTVTGANLLAAGSGYTSSLAQEALVFPSPIVQATTSDFSGTYVLLHDGTVWSKGRNGNGQLGDGTTTDRTTTWAQIPQLTNVTQIAAGGQSAYALIDDGSVRSWGANSSGQLGDGTTADRWSPVTVLASDNTPLTGVTQIAGGFSQCHALMNDGSVKGWGSNNHGELGVGNGGMKLFPTTVVVATDPSDPTASMNTPLSGVTQVSAGRWTTLAVTSAKNVYAWGYNVNGQVGNGNSGNSADVYRATKVFSTNSGGGGERTYLSNAVAVSAGSFSSYALLDDKTVVAWGRNANGELGSSRAAEQSSLPVVVDNLSDVEQIVGGREFAAARQSNGAILTWGSNSSGQLGNGGSQGQSTPRSVSSLQGQSVASIGSLSLGFTLFLVVQV